jgi:uncharacterized delta-60 repeat protein
VPTPITRTSTAARLALLLLCAAAICGAALAYAQTGVPLRNGLDPSFVAWVGPRHVPGEDDSAISEIMILPDGKILIAGTEPKLVRLHPDGSIDTSFTVTDKGQEWVIDLDRLPNGQMYLATVHGPPVFGARSPALVRINADGSHDPSFTPPLVIDDDRLFYLAMEPLPDGRLYVTERFHNSPAGWPQGTWFRLLSNGSFDTSFKVNGKYVQQVLFVDAQGRTYFSNLVAGDGTVEQIPLARLLPDDTIDPSFNPPALDFTEFGVRPQANGGLLITAYKNTPNGDRTFEMVRLLSDGALDPNFVFTPLNLGCCTFYHVTPLADGRFLLGPRQRFLANGAPDPSFEPFPLNLVYRIAEQPDGKLVLGGDFDEVGIPLRRRVARLLADDSPPPSGPPACVVKRYQGFRFKTGLLGDFSRTYYEAGTTFTLHARSSNAVNASVFAEERATTTLDQIGDSFTAASLAEYTVGISSATNNDRDSWVEVNICGPAYAAATPSPTATDTATPSVTATVTVTTSPSPSATPSATATVTVTTSPSPSATATASATATVTSPTGTANPSPSATATTSPGRAPENQVFLPRLETP